LSTTPRLWLSFSIHYTNTWISNSLIARKLRNSWRRFAAQTQNYSPPKPLLTRTFLATLSALAHTFHSRLLTFMGQPNSNIARAGTGSVVYPWLTLNQTTVVEAEANLETALGDAVADEVTADIYGSQERQRRHPNIRR
jgi:hypothetical protein